MFWNKNKNKKYVERAGEILAQIAKRNMDKVKPIDEAAQELIPTMENLAKIEKKFDINRLEMVYFLLKRRYFRRVNFPSMIEMKIKEAKRMAVYFNESAHKDGKKILNEIRKDIKKIEKAILKIDKNYLPKL